MNEIILLITGIAIGAVLTLAWMLSGLFSPREETFEQAMMAKSNAAFGRTDKHEHLFPKATQWDDVVEAVNARPEIQRGDTVVWSGRHYLVGQGMKTLRRKD